MTLFEECLVALGNNAVVLSEKETSTIFEQMAKNFPITTYGRIDWPNIKHVKQISSIEEILLQIETKNDEVYILWDEASLPALKTNLSIALSVIDDVAAVSFDTWVYNPNTGYIIEFYHENEIAIGWVNR
jgi:hypothetical protein